MEPQSNFTFSQPEIDALFARLELLLAKQPLHTHHQGERFVPADEFMLMHSKELPDGTGRCYGFKHRCTRNYVFILNAHNEDRLHVPATGKAFMLGYFDNTYGGI